MQGPIALLLPCLQPERIREVLELVYVNKNMIDDGEPGSRVPCSASGQVARAAEMHCLQPSHLLFLTRSDSGKPLDTPGYCIAPPLLLTELVDSIVQPATDPQASEVFFRINHRCGTRPGGRGHRSGRASSW
jgi:hypothetical protein